MTKYPHVTRKKKRMNKRVYRGYVPNRANRRADSKFNQSFKRGKLGGVSLKL